MTDNIPAWLAVIGIVTLWPVAAYVWWIKPGYEKDKRKKMEK